MQESPNNKIEPKPALAIINPGDAAHFTYGEQVLYAVDQWLNRNGYAFKVSTNSFKRRQYEDGAGDMASAIHLDGTVRVGNKAVGLRHIQEALRQIGRVQRERAIEKLRSNLTVRTCDDTGLRNWLGALLVESISLEEFENCVAVTKQWIWQVKRRLSGLPDSYHICPIFWGGQGGGKSTNIALFLAPIKEFYQVRGFEIFTDQFAQKAMHWNFAIFLDEMQGADRAEAAAIKKAITQRLIEGRTMRTEDGYSLERNASFIAATNTQPGHGLQDTTGGRRFYSLECRGGAGGSAEGEERNKFFNDFDVTEIWGCVDANEEPPLRARLASITATQDRVNRRKSDLEMFLEERCQAEPEAALPFSALKPEYTGWSNQQGGQRPKIGSYDSIAQELRGRGHSVTNTAGRFALKGWKLLDK